MKNFKHLKNVHSFLSLLLILVMALTLLTACGNSDPGTSGDKTTSPVDENPAATAIDPADKNPVTITLASDWGDFNALSNSGGSSYKLYVLNLIFDKLATVKNDGEVEPRLLSDWEKSEDGLTLTGKLNPKAKWHDGTAVTADDVVFSFELYTNPNKGAPSRTLTILKGTDSAGNQVEGETLGIRAIDSTTVAFDLKAPTSAFAFFNDTAYLYIVPKHLLENADLETLHQNPFFENPIGSGPFKYDSETKGSELHLTANTEYHLGAPDFSKLNVRIVPHSNLLSALISGEVDITGGQGVSQLPLADYDLAESEENVHPYFVDSYGATFLVLNNKSDTFSDVRVRKAFEHAIDKEALVNDLFSGHGTVQYGPIASFSPYYDKDLKINEYDPEKAKTLLAEAGYDFNKTLKVIIGSGIETQDRVAVVLQQQLEQVGVKIEVVPMEHSVRMGLLMEQKEDFDFSVLGASITINPSYTKTFWSVGTQGNLGRIDDTTPIKLLLGGDSAATKEEAQALYNQAQQLLEDTVPFIFLYNDQPILAYTDRISNVDLKTIWLADTIWQWKVAN